MKIDELNEIEIEGAHRLGGMENSNGLKPRPIVAKFLRYQNKDQNTSVNPRIFLKALK